MRFLSLQASAERLTPSRLSASLSDRVRRFGRVSGILQYCGLLLCGNPCLAAEPMNFWLIPAAGSAHCVGACSARIAAEGEITDTTPGNFRAFLEANPAANHARVLVFINSPGGKIAASIELGKMFRQIGVTAAVARVVRDGAGRAVAPVGGICASACVYALMGARQRIAPRQSIIGIHRMFAVEGGSMYVDNGAFAAVLKRYSNMMGVSPNLIAAAEQVSPNAIRILTPAEIARWRLASPGS